MGTLCIIIGIILLLGMSGGGFLLANKLANYQIMGQSLLSFMNINSKAMSYVYIMVPCIIIGLLLCLSFVMIGLGNKRINDLEYRLHSVEKSVKKKAKKSAVQNVEAESTEV